MDDFFEKKGYLRILLTVNYYLLFFIKPLYISNF